MDYVSPNDLRRTAGSCLRSEAIALDHIAKVIGHRTWKMVELVYGQMTTSELADLMRQSIGRRPRASRRTRAWVDSGAASGNPRVYQMPTRQATGSTT
jgi:hypothetical protein